MKTVREIGEKYMVNSCHGELVPSLIRAGRMREARRHCDSYLRISRELVYPRHHHRPGPRRPPGHAGEGRGEDAAQRGELLELASEKGIRREEWKAYLYLGWAALLAGDIAEAEKLIEKAQRMSRDLDEKRQGPTMRGLLAVNGPGQHSEATEHLSAAAATFRRVGLSGRAEEAEGLAARVGAGA